MPLSIPTPEELIEEYGRINALLSILKLNDEEAFDHCIEVAKITRRYLTIEEGLKSFAPRSQDEVVDIIKGALLHDVGKAFLPFSLQSSSKRLTPPELEVVKMHPVLGIVATQGCEFSDTIKDIILLHHCNYDGTGYPTKDSEIFPKRYASSPDDIPSYVWIVAYADRYDAMIHKRAFKEPKTLKEAWDEFQRLHFEKKLPYQPIEVFRILMSQDDIFEDSY